MGDDGRGAARVTMEGILLKQRGKRMSAKPMFQVM